jgi:cell division protein FtsB
MGDNGPAIMNQNTKDTPVTFTAQLSEFVRRNANWLLAAGLGLLLLQDVFGTHGLIAMRRSQKEAAQVQQQIDQLNQENQQLLDRVKSLKTDPAAIEQIAREEMGLARPGEYIFRLPDKAGDPSTLAAPPAEAPAKP